MQATRKAHVNSNAIRPDNLDDLMTALGKVKLPPGLLASLVTLAAVADELVSLDVEWVRLGLTKDRKSFAIAVHQANGEVEYGNGTGLLAALTDLSRLYETTPQPF